MRSLFALCLLLPAFQSTLAVRKPKNGPVVSAWYAGWHGTEGFPPEKVSWEKYTQMIYSFAETTDNVHQLTLNGSDPKLLPEFVAIAHANNVQALIAGGGWTGSRFFSTDVGSAENRTAFVNTITSFVLKYDLDGVNFDWEYPNNQGIGCNTINANDTANFLAFLQELRQHPIGAKLNLSAATAIAPFNDQDGNPSTDVSAFAAVLDYIAIMDYDIWGPWYTTVGPNSPLDDSCASPDNQRGSAASAVQAWHGAGVPLNQLVLGCAAYGHSYSVNNSAAFVPGSTTELAPYPGFNATNQPYGDKWDDDPPSIDECGNPQGTGGTFDFWGLIAGGFLNRKGLALPGIAYRFDSCSQTAYVYNKTTEVMVSFDDAAAFKAKGQFINAQQLGGMAIWEAGGDRNDILLDAIRSGMGLPDPSADYGFSISINL